jgi:hypothetical protein
MRRDDVLVLRGLRVRVFPRAVPEMPPHLRVDGRRRMSLQRVPREEFLEHRFHWKPGDHVTVLAPTGWGKTHLLQQLIERVATPATPAVMLVVKPRDDTVEALLTRTGWKRVDTYPPRRLPLAKYFTKEPAGVVVWPKHTFDPDVDDPHIRRTLRTAILHAYKKGNKIVVVDEAYSVGKEYHLDREQVTVLSKGRSMKTSMFGGSQKPTHIPLWFYSQAEHLFLGKDPDKRARQRFGEIGGIDPRLVDAEVQELKRFEFVYIRRSGKDGPEACIVGP